MKLTRKEISANYYQSHKEQCKTRSRKWAKDNRKHASKINLKYQHKRYNAERKPIITALKENGCAICGYNRYTNCLEFHHIMPEDKKFNISVGVYSKSLETLLDEIYKCIILCPTCHCEMDKKGSD